MIARMLFYSRPTRLRPPAPLLKRWSLRSRTTPWHARTATDPATVRPSIPRPNIRGVLSLTTGLPEPLFTAVVVMATPHRLTTLRKLKLMAGALYDTHCLKTMPLKSRPCSRDIVLKWTRIIPASVLKSEEQPNLVTVSSRHQPDIRAVSETHFASLTASDGSGEISAEDDCSACHAECDNVKISTSAASRYDGAGVVRCAYTESAYSGAYCENTTAVAGGANSGDRRCRCRVAAGCGNGDGAVCDEEEISGDV